MPPISAAFARERDASLSLEAERLFTRGLPVCLAGDLNDTPWSTGLKVTAPMEKGNEPGSDLAKRVGMALPSCQWITFW